MIESIIMGAIFISLVSISYLFFSHGALAAEIAAETAELRTERFFRQIYLFASVKRALWLYFASILIVPVLMLAANLPLLLVALAILALILLPPYMMRIVRERRRQNIVLSLPDVLVQLAGSMRAGSTFQTAVQALVDEQDGPLSQEFEVFLREQRVGQRFEEALDNLAERVQSEELDLVVAAIQISQDVGGNLADTLGRLGETLRRKIEMEGKIRALTAQGILQGRVVSALPFLIMIPLSLIEPEAMRPLFNSLFGWVCLAIICCMQFVGSRVIRKIVSIDV